MCYTQKQVQLNSVASTLRSAALFTVSIRSLSEEDRLEYCSRIFPKSAFAQEIAKNTTVEQFYCAIFISMNLQGFVVAELNTLRYDAWFHAHLENRFARGLMFSMQVKYPSISFIPSPILCVLSSIFLAKMKNKIEMASFEMPSRLSVYPACKRTKVKFCEVNQCNTL